MTSLDWMAYIADRNV